MHRVYFTEALTSPLPLQSESGLIICVHIQPSIHKTAADDGQKPLNFETTPKKDNPPTTPGNVGNKVVVIRKQKAVCYAEVINQSPGCDAVLEMPTDCVCFLCYVAGEEWCS